MVSQKKKAQAAERAREVAATGLKNGLGATLTEVAKPAFLGVVSEVVASGVAAGAGAAVVSLVEIWIRNAESVTSHLKSIESDLDILLSVPLQTGLRQARSGYELAAHDCHQMNVREEHLRFAIEQLEQAWTIASDKELSPELLILIRMVQGLCEIRRRGGQHAAKQCFDECLEYVNERTERLSRQLDEASQQLDEIASELDSVEKNARRSSEYRENPRYNPSEPRIAIRPGKLWPDGHLPPPRMIQTFDPTPYREQAKKLRDRRAEQEKQQDDIRVELCECRALIKSLENLHLLDLSDREAVRIGDVL